MNSVLSRENSILSVQLIILLLIAVMQSGWYGSSFQPSYQNFQNLVGCWDDGSVFQQAHNCLNSSGTAMNDLPMNDLPCDGTAFEYLADGYSSPSAVDHPCNHWQPQQQVHFSLSQPLHNHPRISPSRVNRTTIEEPLNQSKIILHVSVDSK